MYISEHDVARDIRRAINEELSGEGYNCDDVPSENAGFVVERDSGERYVVTVTQVEA